jgi:hypothetical protein
MNFANSVLKQNRRNLILFAVSVLSILVYLIPAGEGFPLDDSWIHQTYARNLALRGEWAFTPGIPSGGSTSPLYTVILSVGHRLGFPMLWTDLVAIAALALTSLLAADLAERLFPNVRVARMPIGLLAGLACAFSWHLVWAAASGMETVIFAALCLLMIRILERGAIFGVVAAITVAARPEGALLAAILGVSVLLRRSGQTNLPRWLLSTVIGFAIGIAPYALLNLSISGSLLPNTASAKQAENVPLIARGFLVNFWGMTEPLTAGGQLLLLPGVLYALIRVVRGKDTGADSWLRLALVAWSVALIALYAWRLPAYYQHGRYVIPALPTLYIVGVGGTVLLWRDFRRPGVPRILVRTAAITAGLVFAAFWIIGIGVFAREVDMINSDMVRAANWLANNVPPEQLLAVHDIGAVGYFAPRPVLDLAGLVSPEVIPIILDANALYDLMVAKDVRWLMVLPPQRADFWLNTFCERFNANGGMGGMAIFEYVPEGCG